MAYTTAIYYPWIEIRNESWLRTACLYWDVIRTIVPKSIASPYAHRDSKYLEDEGVLQPLWVSSELDVVEGLADDFIKYLESPEAKAILYESKPGRPAYIHPDKLPPSVRELTHIHPDKLPYKLHDLLHESDTIRRGVGGWMTMQGPLADYYMTLLATRLSNRIGASVATDEASADGLNLVVKTDSTLPNPTRWYRDARRWSMRRNRGGLAPIELAEGALATLALSGLSLRPDVSVERVMQFRKTHSFELGRFRAAIAELAGGIETALPLDAMRQRVWDIYTNELQPAVDALKQALTGSRVDWLANTVLKTTFLSAVPTSLLVTLGSTVPQALIAGAGISLVATGVLYNLSKSQEIRNNPYSYLLQAEKELAR